MIDRIFGRLSQPTPPLPSPRVGPGVLRTRDRAFAIREVRCVSDDPRAREVQHGVTQRFERRQLASYVMGSQDPELDVRKVRASRCIRALAL
jgi:hypothetical protein